MRGPFGAVDFLDLGHWDLGLLGLSEDCSLEVSVFKIGKSEEHWKDHSWDQEVHEKDHEH